MSKNSKTFVVKKIKDEKKFRYGLLGASGCGKTTLLSCIVGAKKLDSGDIWVLGESNVPCNNIGYMPQDISLIEELSVMNVLYYFGRINGLEDHIISTCVINCL